MTTTDPPGPPWSQARVRAGDDDRARAASLLADHYAQGRLDEAELDQRISRALTAVHRDELAALFTDLPAAASGPGRDRPTRPAASRRANGLPWVPSLLVLAVVVVVLTRGAVLWVLPMLWWFSGSARSVRRGSPGKRPGPPGRPLPIGASPGCRAWSQDHHRRR